jgi:hypothetical protein
MREEGFFANTRGSRNSMKTRSLTYYFAVGALKSN